MSLYVNNKWIMLINMCFFMTYDPLPRLSSVVGYKRSGTLTWSRVGEGVQNMSEVIFKAFTVILIYQSYGRTFCLHFQFGVSKSSHRSLFKKICIFSQFGLKEFFGRHRNTQLYLLEREQLWEPPKTRFLERWVFIDINQQLCHS
jgi:hypothetical protein